jgi:hypothetical protein
VKDFTLPVNEEFSEVPVDAFSEETFRTRLEVSENPV